jgi:hypothetical protein
MTAEDDDNEEWVDPVARRNAEDEQRAVELVIIDLDLNDQQEKLERLAHIDQVGLVWFGDDDEWLDRRLDDDE